MLKNVFKKRKKIDLSILGTDIHSHLIPGIDDGAQTMDHTIGMLLKFQELGYKKVVTTPHIIQDLYPNNPTTILNGLKNVKTEIEKLGLDIKIEAAAEYFFDNHLFEQIENDTVLTFEGKHVLFEFSFSTPPARVNELIFALLNKGYIPVLAHYERYMYLQGNMKTAEEYREKGVKIQVNLNSLTGHYGPLVKKTAEKLIDHKLMDLAGTDCHRIEHLQILDKNLSLKHYHKMLDLDLMNYKF